MPVIVVPLTNPFAPRPRHRDVAQFAKSGPARRALDTDGRARMRCYNCPHSSIDGAVAVVKDHEFAVREGLADKIRHRLGEQLETIAAGDAKAADHSGPGMPKR
jgi:hypothetical protein